jgi:hypothetical protein
MIPKNIFIFVEFDCNSIPDDFEKYINNITNLHPDFSIQIYDEAKFQDKLIADFPNIYYKIFNYLDNTLIKSDFFRICMLHKYGGIFIDHDTNVLFNLNLFNNNNLDFLTITVNNYINETIFYPSFIAANENNILIKIILEKYIDMYNDNIPFNFDTFSIINITNNLFNINSNFTKKDGAYYYENIKCDFISETFIDNKRKDYYYNNTLILSKGKEYV